MKQMGAGQTSARESGLSVEAGVTGPVYVELGLRSGPVSVRESGLSVQVGEVCLRRAGAPQRVCVVPSVVWVDAKCDAVLWATTREPLRKKGVKRVEVPPVCCLGN